MKTTQKRSISIIILILITVVFILFTNENKSDFKTLQIYDVFDTYCEISVSDKNADEVLTKANELLHKYNAMWDRNNAKSEISKINQNAGLSPVEISDETYNILDLSQQFNIDTSGYFDITVGTACDLWNIPKNPHIPTNDELSDAIHKTGASYLELNKDNKTAYLNKSGVSITLGAIAKGYVTDKLKKLMNDEKVNSALINLGGNVYAVGTNDQNKEWEIGIQDPNDENGTIGTLNISKKAVITSGSYQRYFEKDGIRYHHLINPYTATPANSSLLSVTIVSDNPIIADMLSTACFIIGYDQSIRLLKEFDAYAIFVTDTNTIYISEDLNECFLHNNTKYEYKTF